MSKRDGKPRCTKTPGCVRNAGHRRLCKILVRLDGHTRTIPVPK